MKLSYFRDISFLQAIKALFNELNVPVNYVADEPTSAQEILKDTYKENSTFQLVNEVYFVGMVDDAAFEGNKSLAVDKIKSDYDGILIFGVSLNQRENNLLPTRSQLAEISRAFNREFYYTPVVLVFKYADDKGQYIGFANTERLQYKQAWREGEKAGKVSLLRDIDIQRPHRGHEDIINQLRIQTSGVKAIDSFAKLYAYWQEVFSVSVLNKRFYQELSNWYFWAVKQVTFPDKPTEADAIKKNTKLDDLIQEHNATNVIRLLTRLLFTWFIKEKKLIPEELFDLEALQKDILNDIAPYHENGLFNQANKDSVYYRAILQNLFFASLNCPIKPDGTDSRERGFRGDGYGTHRGIDYLMRYKRYFKNPDAFLELMNKTVPFLNGGLFECLDDKYSNTYIDGFSDQMTKGEQLIVPDYLFFGTPEEVDLSTEYGVNNNTTKKAAVKGLINILKSYKFTITENTPIEEDVALDPELLGKVFENLLASYNPETKTTARKQTGSFYTPREIVNYMVDESLIAYLKNAVTDCEMDEKQVDEKLHQLASFDAKNPFADNQKLTQDIVSALDRCKILDPACGSGAFPMGVLQKMVHMLQKLDPENLIWKEVQIQKVQEETSEVFKTIDDKAEREEKLKEINNAFDQRVNDPDYARKLYLIENCIYGVDIQPIATQISKLRFFISLVVDQKSNSKADENFGVRPLPNLETKFVTANTLIGINKEANLFTTETVQDLEKQLKHIRHKLFSARTKDTKLKYRQKDEELRKTIAEELKKQGLPVDSAEKLAQWDPYDQNASSPFFDSEWMFDIADGFHVVIGNPPYLGNKEIGAENQKLFKVLFGFTDDMYNYFYHKGISFLTWNGVITYITPNTFLTLTSKKNLRKLFISNKLEELFLVGYVFNEAYVDTIITRVLKNDSSAYEFMYKIAENSFSHPKKYIGNIDLYVKSPDNIFYPPSICNININSYLKDSLTGLYGNYKDFIYTLNSLKKNYSKILKHRSSLKPNDLTLLGLVSEGSQGLVTGNNSKYLAVICQNEVEEQNIIQEFIFKIKNYNNGGNYENLSKNELYQKAERIKVETTNPSFFGKFFLYKTVLFKDVKHFDELTVNEQENGVEGDECWVFYSRGNEDGLKWKVPFVEAINWSKKNVKELKEGIKTNSRWQGSEFYSYTGFGWVDYFTNQIKAFFVEKGPYSKNVVKFHSLINLSDRFFTAILNSKFITYYIKNFLTNTHTLQINDGKLIPIKIPSLSLLSCVELISSIIIFNHRILFEQIIDALVFNLYFPDHMQEREIDVLQFVERDLEKALQGRAFEKLSDTEKEQVIEQLHQTWSHPDSEVRNRIKLFAVRSPEILKPILES